MRIRSDIDLQWEKKKDDGYTHVKVTSVTTANLVHVLRGYVFTNLQKRRRSSRSYDEESENSAVMQ